MKKIHKEERNHQERLKDLYSDSTGILDRILCELQKKTLRVSSSETMSLYSDIPGELYLGGLKNLSSREALALVLCVDREDLIWYFVREKITELCFKYHYQGDWRLIQKILFCDSQDLALNLFLERRSSQELFGNLIGLANRRIQKMKIQRRYSKVRVPQRKRGYNDKGSRKDDSKWLPSVVHLGPNPEREDYRNKVPKSLKERLLYFLWS